MTGLALQIDGKWAVLSDGDSVNIENNSPVWGEGNSFSLPFELDIEANRHILGNADQITGQSVYEVLDGKRAVLYTLGIPVYYGKIKMEDEVELSEGKVDVTLVSGNLTFDEMIDGMNCQDVELLDEFEVGVELDKIVLGFERHGSIDTNPDSFAPEIGNIIQFEVPISTKKFIWNKTMSGTETINVSLPYPQKKYCNVPVATQKKESTKREYVEFDADRPATGICFYVLYFLDCLFHKIGLAVTENRLSDMDDMNRLAFFSTKCDYESKVYIYTPTGQSDLSLSEFGISEATGYRWGQSQSFTEGEITYEVTGDKQNAVGAGIRTLNRMFASSKNFPDVDVSEVVESLKNAFGALFLYDERSSSIRILYLKDILRDRTMKYIHTEIYEAEKRESRINGFELGYSGGSEDNTSYFYNDYKLVDTRYDYSAIRGKVSAYNKTCYIDTKTGDAYRVKVDEEVKEDSTKELNPSLFEVGEFVSAKYGDCSNEDAIEKREISFAPIVSNDVSQVEGESKYMVFLDVEMEEKSALEYQIENRGEYGAVMKMANPYNGDSEDVGPLSVKVPYSKIVATVKYEGYDYQSDNSDGESPINEYDAGFTLGIMRPGSGTRVEDTENNYDGEGNFKYFVIADNPAFISDTIDHYGNMYDYDPAEGVGTDPSGRFSLKPRAEKPNPNAAEGESPFFPITESYAQRRGLFDKFYAEYAYFVVNRKIVKMKCRMEMADLLNIDWTKRYKIGEYVGFINKYSFSVSSSGISDVELEMYYI